MQRFCVLCQRAVDAWVPLELPAGEGSQFLRRLSPVGSNVERYACPHCDSNDRARHLGLYLDRLKILPPLAGGAILHMAPEIQLRHYIRDNSKAARYLSGDIDPPHESTEKIDLQAIPYPDETFDLIVCNHVLEHVGDAGAAMREMYRVLKPGGRAICQTPYAEKLSRTFEEASLQSPEDRLFFYAQEDHVRLFGADIGELLRQAGFAGRLVPHEELLPDIDPEQYGVNEREPFFDFVRPASSRQPRTANFIHNALSSLRKKLD